MAASTYLKQILLRILGARALELPMLEFSILFEVERFEFWTDFKLR